MISRSADVEVLFEFNGVRKHPVYDGYRPMHMILDNYLTTGVHHYYYCERVLPNGQARGTITFITPEAYPHSCWIGRKITIQEGERIIGYATITRILNPLLERIEE